MKRSNSRGYSLFNVLVGGALSTFVAFVAYQFIARYQALSADMARTTEADASIEELSKSIRTLWLGRAQDSVTNCNCAGSEPHCPAVPGGPCSSFQLIAGPVPNCQGLRVFRPVTNVSEYRDYVTVCHQSEMFGVGGPAPAPMIACPASTRPLVERRSNVNGTTATANWTPQLTETDVVAGNACFRQLGNELEVQLRLVVRSARGPKVISRRLLLSTRDRSSNIEYLTK